MELITNKNLLQILKTNPTVLKQMKREIHWENVNQVYRSVLDKYGRQICSNKHVLSLSIFKSLFFDLHILCLILKLSRFFKSGT